MSGFLYFKPGSMVVTSASVAEKLRPIFGSSPIGSGAIDNGPDGPGVLFARSGAGAPKYAYDKAHKWRKCYGGEYWIGWDNPTPADLERSRMTAGYDIALSDGNKWRLPSAKVLPSYFGIDDDGARRWKTRDEYQEIDRLGKRVFDWFTAIREERYDVAITPEEQADIALKCLSINYHVGPYECDALGILSQDDINVILLVLIDSMDLSYAPEEDAKKKQDDDSGA